MKNLKDIFSLQIGGKSIVVDYEVSKMEMLNSFNNNLLISIYNSKLSYEVGDEVVLKIGSIKYYEGKITNIDKITQRVGFILMIQTNYAKNIGNISIQSAIKKGSNIVAMPNVNFKTQYAFAEDKTNKEKVQIIAKKEGLGDYYITSEGEIKFSTIDYKKQEIDLAESSLFILNEIAFLENKSKASLKGVPKIKLSVGDRVLVQKKKYIINKLSYSVSTKKGVAMEIEVEISK